MIQTRSTIQKLLTKHSTKELLQHIAFELEEYRNHWRTVGAHNAADANQMEADVIRKTVKKLKYH